MNAENKETVCVVEDDRNIRRLVVLLLQRRGFEVVEFELAEDAMEWLAQNKPMLTLVDIALPDNSGEYVLEFVRSLPNGAAYATAAVTAFARGGDKERFLRMGFDGYIAKPLNPETFVDEVLEFVRR